ncbi:MAG: DUF4276 family protein [Candidatus Sumerlaeota bacterium]|nr:DUF4276 family protein [Candidatus Sumerlaeota bacterium]
MLPRFVLFGEGEGDTESGALVSMTEKFFKEQGAFGKVNLDKNPFRVGEYKKLLKIRPPEKERTNIHRHIKAALQKGNVSAIIVVLDGDVLDQDKLCPTLAVQKLTEEALKAGAGRLFSFAICFAMQEYESWFIAAAKHKERLPDDWEQPAFESFPADPDLAPRGAKGWISLHLFSGYKATENQNQLTNYFSLEDFRKAQSKSFNHFNRMMIQLINDCISGNRAIHPKP